VKLIRRSEAKLLFRLNQGESRALLELLTLYPRVPPAHQPLSKAGQIPSQHEDQKLLDEALAEQRAESRKQLQALLGDPRRFRKMDSGFHLSLSPAEAEWLLQVLNDIRVGSWVILGSPEGHPHSLNAKTAADFWAMEMAGAFESVLLGALDGEGAEE
jgi:hypothetical protein